MSETYLNPVYHREFPDPFVLKYYGEYWAYCTGFWSDGRCFGILHSTNLVNWDEVGGAMEPLPTNPPYYWAPEVSYYNGRFYLYYSVGNETLMEIRVAVAEHPAGPFIDSGRRLTHEPFAIDAHVFQDEDGNRYLFYATDYLTHPQIGTGTAYDKMLDPFTLAGQSQPVTRAQYDWQVYEPNRIEKGGVRWHTIEGPFVLKHKNHYYQMFSGGNWKNISYGVSYALSDSLTNSQEWQQVADGNQVLPILRTIPGQVIGPGHNSVVRGPNNRQLYCVYHRWAQDGSARLLAIDPLDWAGERMLILGPSTMPHPAPSLPDFSGFPASTSPNETGSGWNFATGQWSVENGVALQKLNTGMAEARFTPDVPYFVAEISIKGLNASGTFGIALHDQKGQELRFGFQPGEDAGFVVTLNDDRPHLLKLSEGFDFQVYHLLSLEVTESRVSFVLDEGQRFNYVLSSPVETFSLFTENSAAAFAGFQLSYGWEDLFTQAGTSNSYGWDGESNWQIREQQLWTQATEKPEIISKGPLLENYEFVVNVRLNSLNDPSGGYGFYPALYADHSGLLFRLEQTGQGGQFIVETPSGLQSFTLPSHFDPTIYQQFRFRKETTHLSFFWEKELLGELIISADPSQVALFAYRATVAFDMVRLTRIIDRVLATRLS